MSDKKQFYAGNNEDLRFEFILKINNNDKPIVSRSFDIRNFNEDSLRSMDTIKEMMDTICGMNNGQYGDMGLIPKYLKKKTQEYLWGMFEHYGENRDGATRDDYFQVEIKMDNFIIAKGEFSGNVFPTKVRYMVNIKEILPTIMSDIKYFLSQKSYSDAEHVFGTPSIVR